MLLNANDIATLFYYYFTSAIWYINTIFAEK
jgi:hypothetical protein